ncbi:MAG: hypothetical protein ABIJ27_02665, partial [Candidatus Omnitrophota bacterium]
MDIFKTWTELNQVCKGREVYLFGRSDDWVLKTVQRLHAAPRGILDNSPSYIGGEFHGLKIASPRT